MFNRKLKEKLALYKNRMDAWERMFHEEEERSFSYMFKIHDLHDEIARLKKVIKDLDPLQELIQRTIAVSEGEESSE